MAVNVSDSDFNERRMVVVVHSGIAGASIAAVVELASRPTVDNMHVVSLGAFAVAIPAAIAMRGATFGALGARLGTAILTGQFEPTTKRDSYLGRLFHGGGPNDRQFTCFMTTPFSTAMPSNTMTRMPIHTVGTPSLFAASARPSMRRAKPWV